MSLVLVTSDRFADHLTPVGHPERSERAEVMQAVAMRFKESGGLVMDPRAATDDDLALVHTREHISNITSRRGRASMIDEDTYTSPESDEVARLAAGAVLTSIDHVLAHPSGTRALVMVRPPGHHAEAGRAMGFCLYNNIAVGAAHARARGCKRVAIVDFDVHHGNGTQWIFYEDPTVLYVSSHQYPFYPGTGAANETGKGAGLGFTLNFPVPAGTKDDEIERLYTEKGLPKVRDFTPDLVLVSAGFDAHERDPLGQLRMTTPGFLRLSRSLVALADSVCDGRIVFATEGGYDTRALAECLQAVIDAC